MTNFLTQIVAPKSSVRPKVKQPVITNDTMLRSSNDETFTVGEFKKAQVVNTIDRYDLLGKFEDALDDETLILDPKVIAKLPSMGTPTLVIESNDWGRRVLISKSDVSSVSFDHELDEDDDEALGYNHAEGRFVFRDERVTPQDDRASMFLVTITHDGWLTIGCQQHKIDLWEDTKNGPFYLSYSGYRDRFNASLPGIRAIMEQMQSIRPKKSTKKEKPVNWEKERVAALKALITEAKAKLTPKKKAVKKAASKKAVKKAASKKAKKTTKRR